MKKLVLLVGGGIAFFTLASFIKKKKENFDHIIKQLKFRLHSLENFDINLKKLSVDLNLIAINPTDEDLYVHTGFIRAKVLRVYEKKTRKLLAYSKLDTNNINIPSKGFMQLPQAHIDIPILSAGEMVFNHFLNTNNAVKNFADKLAFELELEALGQKKIINF